MSDVTVEKNKMNIQWWNLPFSHTTCYTTVSNSADQIISRGVCFFKLENALPFIKSLRLYRG